MAAGIAPAVLVILFRWRYEGGSLALAMVVGISGAGLWKLAGLDAAMNEAAIGIALGLASNFAAIRLFVTQKRPLRL